VIQTFGDNASFHPHLHAIVAEGLFRPNGTFYCLAQRNLKELEEILRSIVLAMLKGEAKVNHELIQKLLAWHQSGFNVHAGNRIARDDRNGQKALAEYILQNAFDEPPPSAVSSEGTLGTFPTGDHRSSLPSNRGTNPLSSSPQTTKRATMRVDLCTISTTTVSHHGGSCHCSRRNRHKNDLNSIDDTFQLKSRKNRFPISSTSGASK